MRRLIAALLLLFAYDVAAEVRCSGSPCVDSSGGFSSPVTTDPVSATGVWTFDNVANTPATFADGLSGGAITATSVSVPSAAAVNSVELGETAGCITIEGATADAFENRVCSADPTVDATFNLRAPGFATTNVLIDSAQTDLGAQIIQGALTINGLASFNNGTAQAGTITGGSYGVNVYNDAKYCFSSTASSAGAPDTCLVRAAAGVVEFRDATTGKSYSMNGGDIALAADFTNATATMSNTALSVTLTASRVYTFALSLFATDSVAAEGLKIDFDGGAATATDFRAHCTIFDTALLASTQTTAIATDFAVALATGASLIECSGAITVNAGGTFIVRAAQNSHATGTLTVNRGSYLWLRDVTP